MLPHYEFQLGHEPRVSIGSNGRVAVLLATGFGVYTLSGMDVFSDQFVLSELRHTDSQYVTPFISSHLTSPNLTIGHEHDTVHC